MSLTPRACRKLHVCIVTFSTTFRTKMENALQNVREIFESELQAKHRLEKHIQAISDTTGANESNSFFISSNQEAIEMIMDEVLKSKPIVITPVGLLILAMGRLLLKSLATFPKQALISSAVNKLCNFHARDTVGADGHVSGQ